MKIATWNIERPDTSSKERNSQIIQALKEVNADILILTETNSLISPGEQYTPYSSEPLPNLKDSIAYKSGENRTTIWSKYRAITRIETSDSSTSVCVSVETPLGELNIYGTVIGVLGNREKSFLPDLKSQILDWGRICGSGDTCIAGDFNITFSDNYYFTKDGRAQILDCFAHLKIDNLTSSLSENIDHIAISESFLKTTKYTTQIWNQDKHLSDHKGVCVSLDY
jgi:endonuclease/exonuclease/phosphatase family metal-dependent hydrolase